MLKITVTGFFPKLCSNILLVIRHQNLIINFNSKECPDLTLSAFLLQNIYVLYYLIYYASHKCYRPAIIAYYIISHTLLFQCYTLFHIAHASENNDKTKGAVWKCVWFILITLCMWRCKVDNFLIMMICCVKGRKNGIKAHFHNILGIRRS